MLRPLAAHLLDAASRAPSAHNTQPWLLGLRDEGLEIRVRRERTLPAGDPSGNDALHSIGAMLENVMLTLGQLGYSAEYLTADRFEPGSPVVTVRWRPNESPRPDSGLYRMIPIRRTSRLPYRDEPVPEEAVSAMRAAAQPFALHVLDDRDRLQALRALVKEATILQLADAPVSSELHEWLRFSRSDPRWYRDGLNAACLGWSGVEAAAARWLLSPGPLGLLVKLGLHRVLAADANEHMPATRAVCLLVLSEDGVAARVEAGRRLQRVWLTAAARGLVTHPLSAALDVAEARPRALVLFGLPADQRTVNLFRVGSSPPPVRSARLPVDEILDGGT